MLLLLKVELIYERQIIDCKRPTISSQHKAEQLIQAAKWVHLAPRDVSLCVIFYPKAELINVSSVIIHVSHVFELSLPFI